jgi:hypothetical protein
MSAIQLPRATTEPPGRTMHGPGDTNTRIERIRALGRTDELLLTRETTGYEGQIQIRTSDRALIQQLRAWKEAGTVVLFATPYGESRYIRILTTPDTDDLAAWINASMGYVQVNPTAADFY